MPTAHIWCLDKVSYLLSLHVAEMFFLKNVLTLFYFLPAFAPFPRLYGFKTLNFDLLVKFPKISFFVVYLFTLMILICWPIDVLIFYLLEYAADQRDVAFCYVKYVNIILWISRKFCAFTIRPVHLNEIKICTLWTAVLPDCGRLIDYACNWSIICSRIWSEYLFLILFENAKMQFLWTKEDSYACFIGFLISEYWKRCFNF